MTKVECTILQSVELILKAKYSTLAHGGPVWLGVNVEILFLLVTKIVLRKIGNGGG